MIRLGTHYYHVRRMTGRCSNGWERGGGKRTHAVTAGMLTRWDKALCGARPGRLSAGWSDPIKSSFVEDATCPRCLARINRSVDQQVVPELTSKSS